MDARSAGDHKIEPEFLGPLGDRPLVEQAGKSLPDDLFPGASKFLSSRQQRKRREQWNAVRPMVKRLLQPGEHILHVVYATQVPPFLHSVGLGRSGTARSAASLCRRRPSHAPAAAPGSARRGSRPCCPSPSRGPVSSTSAIPSWGRSTSWAKPCSSPCGWPCSWVRPSRTGSVRPSPSERCSSS